MLFFDVGKRVFSNTFISNYVNGYRIVWIEYLLIKKCPEEMKVEFSLLNLKWEGR